MDVIIEAPQVPLVEVFDRKGAEYSPCTPAVFDH